MKVLVVNDHFHEVAGAEVYTLSLCAGLRARGVQVVGFCAATAGIAEDVPYPLYRVGRLPGDVSWRVGRLYNPRARRALATVVAAERPDVIHYQGVFSRVSPAVVEAAGGLPSVMTVHDYRFDCSQSKLDRAGCVCPDSTTYGMYPCLLRGCAPPHHFLYQTIRNRVVARTLKRLQVVIGPSRFMQRYLMTTVDTETIFLPYGIDGSKFALCPPRCDGVVLFVGRIVPEKGLPTLIAAMRILARARPGARLRIVGGGPSEERIRQHVRAANLENVDWVGRIPHLRIPAHYAEADVVCIPSVWPDNSPLVAYESMAAGRAVVASEVGGLPDLVDDYVTGRLVPPGNAAALASALAEVLDGRSVVYGEAASRKFEKGFTLDRHIDAILDLYGRVVRDHRSNRC